MPSRHDTTDCLTDIIENAERIAPYLSDVNEAAFAGNGLVRDAVERCLERICEAAHRLGSDAADLMPGQPWSDRRGMGIRLRQAYDRISAAVIWPAAKLDVPGLAVDARRALVLLRKSHDPV